MKIFKKFFVACSVFFAAGFALAQNPPSPVAFTQCFTSRPNASEVKQGNCYDYREVATAVPGERAYSAARVGRSAELFRMIVDKEGNFIRTEGGFPTASNRPSQLRVWANPQVGEKRTMHYVRINPDGQEFPVRVDSHVTKVGKEMIGGVELSVARFKVVEYVTDPGSARGVLVREIEIIRCDVFSLICGADSPYFMGYANGIYWRILNPAILGSKLAEERVAEAR